MNDPLFKTITGDDWKRSLASARGTHNDVAGQIRAAALPVMRSRLLRVLQLRAADQDQALNLDMLLNILYRMKRNRDEAEEAEHYKRKHGPRVDMDKVLEHGIRHAWEGDTLLTSFSEMKRARDVGAIVDAPAEGWPDA